MEHGKEMGKLINEYDTTPIPEDGIRRMEAKINQAKLDKRRAKRQRMRRHFGAGAAAAFAVLLILPNLNGNIAYAMGQLPVVGKLFEVITIRDYDYEWVYENGEKSLKVKIPQVRVKDGKDKLGSDRVNEKVQQYINELQARFEEEIKQNEGGYQSLDVGYQVLTNNEKWFSLDIEAVETQASGYEFHRFYTIDKETGKVLELKDLFREGADYVSVISEEIIRQMRQETDNMYWIDDTEIPREENFSAIQPDQNFYINKDGHLVIAFDEYEVAAGVMGAPQFVIPDSVLEGIRK